MKKINIYCLLFLSLFSCKVTDKYNECFTSKYTIKNGLSKEVLIKAYSKGVINIEWKILPQNLVEFETLCRIYGSQPFEEQDSVVMYFEDKKKTDYNCLLYGVDVTKFQNCKADTLSFFYSLRYYPMQFSGNYRRIYTIDKADSLELK